MRRIDGIILVIVLAGLCCSSAAWGHYLTLNVDNYFPAVGETVTVSLGMGHVFPESQSCAIERMARIYYVDPDGNEVPVDMTPGDDNRVAPMSLRFDQPGTYLLVAWKKDGFVTKTPDGYQYKPKDAFKHPIKSYWSEGNAKALVVVGNGSGKDFNREIAARYQVILDTNPAAMGKNDLAAVSVIFDGKPHNTQLLSTYAGFSDEAETYAYATRSKQGAARIRMLETGVWLIKASDTFPYPDARKADLSSFTSTVTFGIR